MEQMSLWGADVLGSRCLYGEQLFYREQMFYRGQMLL